MTDYDIASLCRQHGAKILSDAAYAAMESRHAALDALGLQDVRGMGLLYRITSVAYPLMSDEDQAADATHAAIQGARL